MRESRQLAAWLQLFDAAAGAAPDGSGTGQTAQPSGEAAPAPEGEQACREGSDAGSSEQSLGPQDDEAGRRERFRTLVEGELKDLYDARVQRIINDRFKKEKAAREQLQQQLEQSRRQLLEMQSALEKAPDADDELQQRLQQENRRLRRGEQLRCSRDIRRQVEQWGREGKDLEKAYPRFRLEQAAKDPRFLQLLQGGLSVRTAYEALHMDAVKHSLARAVARATEQTLRENLRRSADRPVENGCAAHSGVLMKTDVSRLSRRDREDMARRAQRGERISL